MIEILIIFLYNKSLGTCIAGKGKYGHSREPCTVCMLYMYVHMYMYVQCMCICMGTCVWKPMPWPSLSQYTCTSQSAHPPPCHSLLLYVCLGIVWHPIACRGRPRRQVISLLQCGMYQKLAMRWRMYLIWFNGLNPVN